MNSNITPQIVFVEGIHGAGKSTLAKSIAVKLKRDNPNIKVYLRSESPNPIDLCRLACFSQSEYDYFVALISKELDKPKELINSNLFPYIVHENKNVFVNWYDYLSQFHMGTPISISFALEHELCDGKAGIKRYKDVTLDRWINFSKNIDTDGVYIFEGVLFQHPLAEMMGYYMVDDEKIISFIKELITCIKRIEMKLFYILVTDVEKILLNAALERSDVQNNWIQGFLKMISTCNYGIENRLTGMNGAVKYCMDRIKIERKIMKAIDMPIHIIERI